MARSGWGTGAWGNFKWGGEDGGDVFTPVITGATITLLPSSGTVKRIDIASSNLVIALLPTPTLTRVLRANLTLSLLPSGDSLSADYQINENGVSFSLFPSTLTTRVYPISGATLSLLSSATVTANPQVNATVSLTPSNESLTHSSTVTSDLSLSLTPSYESITPTYTIGLNNLILSIVPNSTVYGWACDKREDTTFTSKSRESSSWTDTSRQSTTFNNIGRQTETWIDKSRKTSEYSEVAR